jgi:hypothetical protein
MVLFALVLVVLMIFASLAVDIGAAYSQKRQNQSASDEGALAGGLTFLLTGNYDKAVQALKQVVGENLSPPPTDAEWAACKDPGAYEISSLSLSPTYGSPCISFRPFGTHGQIDMRVRLPNVSQTTIFGGVIGMKKLTTSAITVVRIGHPLGGALPSYVFSGVLSGDSICPFNGTKGNGGPCSGQSRGSFGSFQPYYYEPSANCSSGNQGGGNDWSVAPAIALGIDHLLVPYSDYLTDPTSSHQRVNGDNKCSVLAPNTVQPLTGSMSGNPMSQGLVTGGGTVGGSPPAYTGRLAGGLYTTGGPDGNLNTAKILKVAVDNAPLWYFLSPDIKDNGAVPLACRQALDLSPKRDVAMTELPTGYDSPEALMSACLSQWKVGDGVLFSESVGNTKRLGAVPRFWEDVAQQSGSVYFHIKDFVPIFLDAEFQAKASDGTDPATTHWAGDPITTASQLSAWNNANLAAEGGMFIPCLSLPGDLCRQVNPDPADNGLAGVLGGVALVQ